MVGDKTRVSTGGEGGERGGEHNNTALPCHPCACCAFLRSFGEEMRLPAPIIIAGSSHPKFVPPSPALPCCVQHRSASRRANNTRDRTRCTRRSCVATTAWLTHAGTGIFRKQCFYVWQLHVPSSSRAWMGGLLLSLSLSPFLSLYT